MVIAQTPRAPWLTWSAKNVQMVCIVCVTITPRAVDSPFGRVESKAEGACSCLFEFIFLSELLKGGPTPRCQNGVLHILIWYMNSPSSKILISLKGDPIEGASLFVDMYTHAHEWVCAAHGHFWHPMTIVIAKTSYELTHVHRMIRRSHACQGDCARISFSRWSCTPPNLLCDMLFVDLFAFV